MPTVRLYGPQWAVRMTISGPIGGILCLYAIGANGRDSAGMKKIPAPIFGSRVCCILLGFTKIIFPAQEINGEKSI